MRSDALQSDALLSSRPDQRETATRKIQRNPVEIEKVSDETAEQVRRDFETFLSNFEDSETNTFLYVEQIKLLPTANSSTIYIDFSHLENHNDILADAIQLHYYRMEPFIKKAIQNLVRLHEPQYLQTTMHNNSETEGALREFSVAWYGLSSTKRLRELRMEHQSQLVCISGTVTRTSPVRPELLFGTFECKDCGAIIRDVEQEFIYKEPTTCLVEACGNRSDFSLLTGQSRFADWQKIRIQENADEVPSGAMPRSMDVILRNEVVERAKAGDRINVVGSPLVIPDVAQLIGNKLNFNRDSSDRRGQEGFGQEKITGLKALGAREMNFKTMFLATFVQQVNEKNALSALHDMGENDPHSTWIAQLSQEQKDKIDSMKKDRRIYQKLARSISPHIYGKLLHNVGHEDIKKGILLQLLGGVHKVTHEGINLRGDINVCVVGDPSTAKSQFLKFVAGFMPRAIYTSGKASSAAGLTASVMKDEETGEMTIEAGALMLADNGICCIDEFDKMDLKDQVAIHEAMEQQTISITKAGIQATLNARASILAAANPIHGRYDKKLSLKQNIAMSPPIMSRFDLFFILLDDCHEPTDLCIAQHIINFHRFQEKGVQPEFSMEELKTYLTYAKGLRPIMTEEALEYLVTQYRNIRQEDATGVSKSSYRITVRQLESMVRLSEALAKLSASDEILLQHVTEAAYLLKTSIVHVEQESMSLDVPQTAEDQVGEMDQDGMVMDEVMDETTKNKKITLTAQDYNKICKSIVLQIQRHERSTNDAGMTRSSIINWYLEMMEQAEQIDTEDDYLYQKKLIKTVLGRMVNVENTLMQMKDVSRLDETEKDENDAEGDDPILVINPAYCDE